MNRNKMDELFGSDAGYLIDLVLKKGSYAQLLSAVLGRMKEINEYLSEWLEDGAVIYVHGLYRMDTNYITDTVDTARIAELVSEYNKCFRLKEAIFWNWC